jgi:hypothetical protein
MIRPPKPPAQEGPYSQPEGMLLFYDSGPPTLNSKGMLLFEISLVNESLLGPALPT